MNDFVLENQNVVMKTNSWYVLDEDFSFDVEELRRDIFSYIKERGTPVIFCDTCDANRIASLLGQDEKEFVFAPAAIFWEELDMIFVFRYEEYEPLLETLFHEFRHVSQYHDPSIRPLFTSESHLPYSERWIEKDAFAFAKQKVEEFKKHTYYHHSY